MWGKVTMRRGGMRLFQKSTSSCSPSYGRMTHLRYSVSFLSTTSKNPSIEDSYDDIDNYSQEENTIFSSKNNIETVHQYLQQDESSDTAPSPMMDLAKWVDTTVTAMDGKVFPSSHQLIPLQKSVVFPTQECFCLLDGKPLHIPDDVESGVKVIIMSFRHYGFSLLRSWLAVFEENVDQMEPKDIQALKKSIPPVKIIELCFIEAGILSMAKNVMAKSMRNKLEQHRLSDSYIRFGGIMDIATKLSLPNIYTGYIFVLDKQNNVRWRASGEPNEREIKTMLKCISQLSKSNA